MPTTRYAALLFADIEDSTRIAQVLTDSPEGNVYPEFSVAYEELLRRTCSDHSGAVGGTWGDDFFATFDAPGDALVAAIEITRSIAERSWPLGIDLRVRLGLHYGRIIESTRGFVGIELHRAMRICMLARGAEVLASRAFLEAHGDTVPPGQTVIDLGLRGLKGFAAPEPVFQIAPAGILPHAHDPGSPLGDWQRPLSRIVGREAELTALSELLHRPDTRLVSVLGPGGVGKTRLCEEVAFLEQHRFPGGAYMVNLSEVENPALVPGRTARALGLASEAVRADADLVGDFLADRSVLLLFDNFEQVRGAAPFVRGLLSRCPNTRALVTSRVPLGLRGEQRFELRPLAVQPAATAVEPGSIGPASDLFIQRARELDPDLVLTPATRALVDDICTTVDGLPLAIELAAAQVDSVSLAALARGLRAQPLRYLGSHGQDYPRRQSTMASAISWSYDLIEDEEDRAILDALAIFAGGFRLAQATALLQLLGRTSAEEDVAAAIERLRRRSLIQLVHADEPRRYRLLRVIREFAIARLEAAGEANTVRAAHLAVHTRIAQRAEASLQGETQLEVMEALGEDIENIRAALACSLSTPDLVSAGLRLASSLTVYWWHGHLQEGSQWLRDLVAAAARTGSEDAGRLAQAHLTVALLELYGGSLTNARAEVARCLEIADPSPRTAAIQALATALSGMIEAASGDHDRGEQRCDDGVRRLEAIELPWMLAIALEWQGEAALRAGHAAAAAQAWSRSVELFRGLGDRWLLAAPLARLGELALDHGDLAAATESLDESIELLRVVGTGAGTAQVLASLGRLARAQGRSHDALALAGESLRAASAAGSWVEVDLGLSLLAALCAESSEPQLLTDAARLLGAAQTIRAAAGPLAASTIRRGDAALAARLRAALGDHAFEAAWSAGLSAPTGEVIADAIGIADHAGH